MYMSVLWTPRQEGMPVVGEVIKRSTSCAELFPDDLLQHYRSKYGKWCRVFYSPVKTDRFVFLCIARLFIYIWICVSGLDVSTPEKIGFVSIFIFKLQKSLQNLLGKLFLSLTANTCVMYMWRKRPDSLDCIRLNKDQFSVLKTCIITQFKYLYVFLLAVL